MAAPAPTPSVEVEAAEAKETAVARVMEADSVAVVASSAGTEAEAAPLAACT